MDIPALFTTTFWNGLARSYLPELVTILTATIVVLLDRPVRRQVHRLTKSYNRVLRFLIFAAVCSFGYAALSVGCAFLVRFTLTVQKGQYMAPIAFAILIVVGIVAERQKQI